MEASGLPQHVGWNRVGEYWQGKYNRDKDIR